MLARIATRANRHAAPLVARHAAYANNNLHTYNNNNRTVNNQQQQRRNLATSNLPTSADTEVDSDDFVKLIDEQIDMVRAKLDDTDSVDPYPEAEFKADAEKGTIDVSRLAEAMEGESFAAIRAVTLARAAEINEMVRKTALLETKATAVDWDEWTAKFNELGMGDFIAKFKADVTKEAEEEMAAFRAEQAAQTEAFEKEHAAKSAELMSNLKKLDAVARECLEGHIVDLEAMRKQVLGLNELTTAEVLEADPEMRRAFEEDMENNIWAPDAIPEKLRVKYGLPEDGKPTASTGAGIQLETTAEIKDHFADHPDMEEAETKKLLKEVEDLEAASKKQVAA